MKQDKKELLHCNAKKSNEKKPSILTDDKTKTSTSDEKYLWKGLGVIEKVSIVGLCLLLVVGAMGSSLGDSIIKTFSINPKHDSVNSKNSPNSEGSLFSKLKPFSNPSPSPTPQLSKEYIYAGSRMLAVEDANATVSPPVDLAVWRPSSGTWWVMGGVGSEQTSQHWGIATDIPTQGDFDGDGKTDFCVYREVYGSNSQWYYVNSSDNTTGSIAFGLQGDKPAQADFDGDGRTDFAVYRPGITDGIWYILDSSTGNTESTQFGLSNDVPIPQDFDGDGKADIALWRDSNATFYSSNSSNGYLNSTTYGARGDRPVSADFDGDGRADVAVYRQSNATWYIQESSTTNNLIYQWGVATDTLVHNDYDGDGKVDVAVWRGTESTTGANDVGKWYIRNSSDGSMRIETWGIAGDIPVPAFYRRGT